MRHAICSSSEACRTTKVKNFFFSPLGSGANAAFTVFKGGGQVGEADVWRGVGNGTL